MPRAAGGNPLADLGLVAVDLRGVDGTVAEFKRGADGVDDDLVFQAEEVMAFLVKNGGMKQA